MYFWNKPSLFMINCTPRFPSTTSNPGRPARHSVSARSETCVEEPRQYSTSIPYFFFEGLMEPLHGLRHHGAVHHHFAFLFARVYVRLLR